jgi:hypothetical protein
MLVSKCASKFNLHRYNTAKIYGYDIIDTGVGASGSAVEKLKVRPMTTIHILLLYSLHRRCTRLTRLLLEHLTSLGGVSARSRSRMQCCVLRGYTQIVYRGCFQRV